MFYNIWATGVHINIISFQQYTTSHRIILLFCYDISQSHNYYLDRIKISYLFILYILGQGRSPEMRKPNQPKPRNFLASNLNILILSTLISEVLGNNYLFLGLGVQLYIPGQRYSSLNVQYNTDPLETKRFSININLSLNQTAQNNQSNTVFDLLTCDSADAPACQACFTQNYDYLNARYAKYEPCMETCNNSLLPSFQNKTMLTSYSKNITKGGLFLIDNTFFPCSQGAYQPELYLEQFIDISIQQNSAYGVFTKIVFVLLLQIMTIVIAYLIIMFKKYRKLKKKLEYIKGQEQAQDLLNSFLVGASK